MILGLYQSALGAKVQSTRQDVLSNNLANASTNSFKRDLLRVQAHPSFDEAQGTGTYSPQRLDKIAGGSLPSSVVTDFRMGPLTPTQAPFDAALSGPGFFQVSDGKRNYLTRDGQFSLNSQGHLVTREQGLAVLGPGGTPITGINPLEPIDIRSDGLISQNGVEIGRLNIVQPASPQQLTKQGRNLYSNVGPLAPVSPDTQVRQGYLEASGTQPITEMMELIEAARGFEANINMIKHQDESLERLLQSAARR